MKSLNEIVSGEGKINIIPKTDDISLRLLISNIPKETKKIVNSRNILNQKSSINTLSLCDTIKLKKHFTKLKSLSDNSTTSTTTNNEKIKKVTFSTVSIIRIKNYKKFNKLNTYKIDDNRNNLEKSETCDIF